MKKTIFLSLLIAVSACFITSTKANTVINNDSSPPTVSNVVNDLKEKNVEISVMESMPVELSTYVFEATPTMVIVDRVIVTKANTVTVVPTQTPAKENLYIGNCSCPECTVDRCSQASVFRHSEHKHTTNYNYANIKRTNLTKTSAIAPVRYRIANSKVNLRASSRV